eukprot:s719_g31.t1
MDTSLRLRRTPGPYGVPTGVGCTSEEVLQVPPETCHREFSQVAALVRGMPVRDLDLPKAWHLATSTFTLCGKRDTYGTQLGLVTRLVAAGAASFCVAGVALGDMDLRFVWQAWHLATSTFTLCGRRGTYGTRLGLVRRLGAAGAASFCVAGVALGHMDLRFVWQV